jgi:excinuclease ABC subunit A
VKKRHYQYMSKQKINQNPSDQELRELNNSTLLTDTTFLPNPNNYITVRGAKEHNLKNVSVILPKNKLVVFSGLSGSGKSSLVFDTIYAEGQRRYVESLSAYARQFLGLKEKPEVDSIDGLSPAISIDQKSTSQNPRSTVGTITEIYDYLRLLYAKVGHQHCSECDAVISNESVTNISNRYIRELAGKTVLVLAPLINDQKGVHKQVMFKAKEDGFRRLRVDGEILIVDEALKLELNKQTRHSVEIVVDRVEMDDDNKVRLINSLETAIVHGDGKAMLLQMEDDENNEKVIHINKNRACPNGHGTPPALEPRLFSFNSPHGACEMCNGLGVVTEIDADLIVPNDTLTIMEGCLKPLSRVSMSGGWLTKTLETIAVKYNFDLDTPWKELPEKGKKALLYGDEGFEGVISNLKRRYKDATSDSARRDIESYMQKNICKSCGGARLRKEALHVYVADTSIHKVVNLSIIKAIDWIEAVANNTELSRNELEISRMILKEITFRLKFLRDVGLQYLTISRSSDTLSGGEAQRIRLATQIGSGLTGVLYILDEPSIGLHQRDNTRLLETLKKLRDLGNSVLVVEHDEETILSSDFIVDVGPKAGEHGGNIVAVGTPEQIKKDINSPTGRFLSGKDIIEIPKIRRKVILSKPSNESKVDEYEYDLKQHWVEKVEKFIKNK